MKGYRWSHLHASQRRYVVSWRKQLIKLFDPLKKSSFSDIFFLLSMNLILFRTQQLIESIGKNKTKQNIWIECCSKGLVQNYFVTCEKEIKHCAVNLNSFGALVFSGLFFFIAAGAFANSATLPKFPFKCIFTSMGLSQLRLVSLLDVTNALGLDFIIKRSYFAEIWVSLFIPRQACEKNGLRAPVCQVTV